MKAKIQQLSADLKLQPKQIYILGGVLSFGVAAFAAYKLWTKGKSTSTSKTPVQQQKSFEQTYKEVIKSVQQTVSKYGSLNGEVIKCILKNQYTLAQEEFVEFMLKMRTQRRKFIKDKHQYGGSVLSFEVADQELMDKHLNAILAHFNIDKGFWIETVQLWSSQTQQNKQQWQNLLVELQTQQLDALRDHKKKPLSLKKLQQIINFKIHSLKHLNESGLDLDSSNTSDQQTDINAKYVLIDTYIKDLVFNKFGVEEEDINFSQNQLSQEDKNKFAEISDQYTELIRVQIFGDESIEDQEQENQVKSQQHNDENDDEQNNLAADKDNEDEGQYF